MAEAPGAGPGAARAELVLAAAVLAIVVILIVPVPAAGLDVLLALSVGMSLLMLLIALGLTRALDFSVFPSILLITTLFRLALNVATTRLILLHGGEGPGAAGHLIETFGRFAVGGSLVVGLVIFVILLVVNFAVITKGANRVSEVAARFTLDAMPGKQMSIDADLAAGIIDDREAKARRGALEKETEFFGAMDGASKFVRGDAVAGLAITVINIVGGLVAGLVRDHVSLAQAAETYTLLTVGDGLVSQIPALLVSTSAGIVVTRAAGERPRHAGGRADVRAAPAPSPPPPASWRRWGSSPACPSSPSGGVGGGLYLLSRRAARAALLAATPRAKAAAAAGEKPPEKVQDLLTVEPLQLEVGFALVPLIDLDKGARAAGARDRAAQAARHRPRHRAALGAPARQPAPRRQRLPRPPAGPGDRQGRGARRPAHGARPDRRRSPHRGPAAARTRPSACPRCGCTRPTGPAPRRPG